jgi:hypothetical protein
MYTLTCQGIEFKVTLATLQQLPRLYEAAVVTSQTELIVENIPAKQFGYIIETLEKMTMAKVSSLNYFEMLGVGIVDNYQVAIAHEANFRQHCKKSYFTSHYGLVELTEELWATIAYEVTAGPEVLTYGQKRIKNTWEDIQADLTTLRSYDLPTKSVITGISIYDVLFGVSRFEQTMVSFYDSTAEEIEKHIVDLCAGGSTTTAARSQSSLTISNSTRCLVTSLFQYRSIAEVLYSAKVDCYGLGSDGVKIWMTERCWYALHNRCNTYNPIFSDDYENALTTACIRGMAIQLPTLNKTRIDRGLLEQAYLDYTAGDGCTLEGIDVLLLFNYIFEKESDYSSRNISSFWYGTIIWHISKIFDELPDDEKNDYYNRFSPLVVAKEEGNWHGIMSILAVCTSEVDRRCSIPDIWKSRVGVTTNDRVIDIEGTAGLHEYLHIHPLIYEAVKMIGEPDFPQDIEWIQSVLTPFVVESKQLESQFLLQ